MEASEKIVVKREQEYRIKRSKESSGLLFTLEAYYEPYWYERQKWDDPGYVADLLVKLGEAADYQSAFEMLMV